MKTFEEKEFVEKKIIDLFIEHHFSLEEFISLMDLMISNRLTSRRSKDV